MKNLNDELISKFPDPRSYPNLKKTTAWWVARVAAMVVKVVVTAKAVTAVVAAMAVNNKVEDSTAPHQEEEVAATARAATAAVVAVAATAKAAEVAPVAVMTAVVEATATAKVAEVATLIMEVAVAVAEATAALPQVMVAEVVVVVMVVAAGMEDVLPNATKKILFSSADWEISSSTMLNRSSFKVTCSQCAFECSLTRVASLKALPLLTLRTPTQRKKRASLTAVRQVQPVAECVLTRLEASLAHAEKGLKQSTTYRIEPKTQLKQHCTTLSLTT